MRLVRILKYPQLWWKHNAMWVRLWIFSKSCWDLHYYREFSIHFERADNSINQDYRTWLWFQYSIGMLFGIWWSRYELCYNFSWLHLYQKKISWLILIEWFILTQEYDMAELACGRPYHCYPLGGATSSEIGEQVVLLFADCDQSVQTWGSQGQGQKSI